MSVWIRRNAQAELRDNMRSLLRERRLPHRVAAAAAGLNQSQFNGRLNNPGWFTPCEVRGVAYLLEVTEGELLGGSAYADDPQLDRFDFNPNQPPAQEPETDDSRVRALCCTCGTLRSVARNNVHSDAWRDDAINTTILYCDTCESQVRHATVQGPARRQTQDALLNRPSRGSIALADVKALVARLESHNVDIHPRAFSEKRRREAYVVYSKFDTSKSRWRIEYDDCLPPVTIAISLREVWNHIATDTWPDDIDFDPREGALWCVQDSQWQRAADQLVQDIETQTPLARRHMVAELNGRIDAQQRDAEWGAR